MMDTESWASDVGLLIAMGDVDGAENSAGFGLERAERTAAASNLRYQAEVLDLRFAWRTALAKLDEGARTAEQLLDSYEALRCWGAKAIMEAQHGRARESRRSIGRCQEVAAALDDDHLVGWSDCLLTGYCLARQQTLEACRAFGRLWDLLKARPDAQLGVAASALLPLLRSCPHSRNFALPEPAEAASVLLNGWTSPLAASAVFELVNLSLFAGATRDGYALLSSMCSQAEARLDERGTALFLGILGSRLVKARWNGSGIPLLRRAAESAERLSLTAAEAIWRSELGAALLWIGEAEGFAEISKSTITAGQLHYGHRVALNRLALAGDHTRQGALQDAQECISAVAEAVKQRQDLKLRMCLLLEATALAEACDKLDKAVGLVTEAFQLAQQEGPEPELTRPLLVQGAIREARGDDDGAKACYEDAWAIARRQTQFYEYLEAVGGLAINATNRGAFEVANNYYRILRAFLDVAQGDYTRVDQRLRIQERARAVLETDLSVSLLLAGRDGDGAYLHDAFDAAQIFHNRALTDAILHQEASPNMPAKLIQDFLVVEEHTRTHSSSWHGAPWVQVETAGRNLEPRDLRQFGTVSLDEVRALLEPGEVFLQTVRAEDVYVLLPVLRDRLVMPSIVPRAGVDREVSELLEVTNLCSESTYDGILSLRDRFEDCLSRLHIELRISEFLEQLRPTQLLVTLDPDLASIPFHALRDAHNGSYLLDNLPEGLSYWPSATAYCRGATRRPQRRCLLISPEDPASAAVAEENERVTSLYDEVTGLFAGRATRANVAALALNHDVLYFCGHGDRTADQDAVTAYLQLADGPLTIPAILRGDITFRPGTVGLFNCCRVGGMAVGQGAELAGFVRALYYAGMSTVVAGLWYIEEYAAAHTMPLVAQGLRSGASLSAAVRAAMSHTRRTWKHPTLGTVPDHPYFWAGYQWWGR